MPATMFAAFDQGQVPTISCVNKAKLPLGVDFDKLVAALQTFVDAHFVGVWGTPCLLVRTDGKIPKKNWAIVVLDHPDDPDAEGYHDLTKSGLPLSKVFVEPTIADGGKVSVTTSHELAEMLVDPGLQMGACGPRNVWYGYETADAVEDYSFEIDGVAMTDFVYPAWFESFRTPHSTKFDHMGKCRKPFEILKGGYMPIFRAGKWTERFPSPKKKRKFNKRFHPRTLCRSTPGPLKRSVTA